MAEKELMTAKGMEMLKEKLASFEKELSDLRIYKSQEAWHAGDAWHDNPILFQVEAKERGLMEEIAKTKKRIAGAEVVKTLGGSDRVVFGSKVKVCFSDGVVEAFQILGEVDSDLGADVISYLSPLGQALLGKKRGERVSFTAGVTKEDVQIFEIIA